MARPVLLAVAHGSRDPAALGCLAALAARVRRLDPGVDVRLAFLSHGRPALAEALGRAAAEAGPGAVTVVPLLLAPGYHLNTDIRPAAAAAGAAVSSPLGPDPALTEVLAARLAEAGAPAGTPVVLAAAGSDDPAAAPAVSHQAALLATRLRVPVVPACLSGTPTVEEAVISLAGQTGRDSPASREGRGAGVAVASCLLAPGQFQGRLRAAPAAWVSGPLGAHPALARLVLTRFRSARRAASTAMPAGRRPAPYQSAAGR